ncbi:MAG: Lrp/AsnC family transcriptional regulator [Chloroflexi bacterium]|nr:Lrp/AsnC family transcriptional regulator [Chloroflexota bacterium]
MRRESRREDAIAVHGGVRDGKSQSRRRGKQQDGSVTPASAGPEDQSRVKATGPLQGTGHKNAFSETQIDGCAWDGYIDSRDLAIILELQKDGRQSDARISRQLGTSEVTIRKRISRLIGEGTIRVVAAPVPWMVGYCVDARIGLRVDLSRVKQILEQLVGMATVHFVALTAGRHNIMISVAFRSPHELSDFLANDLSTVPGIFRSDTFVTLETRKRQHDILQPVRKAAHRLRQKTARVSATGATPVRTTGKMIDRADCDIIVELQRDARQSDATLARKLALSEATVRRRIKRLIGDHVIEVVPAMLPAKVGYVTSAHIGLQVSPAMLDAVLGRLVEMPRVHTVVLTAGEFDILAWASFVSPSELSSFIRNDISSISGVLRTETMIDLDIKKMELGILPSQSATEASG